MISKKTQERLIHGILLASGCISILAVLLIFIFLAAQGFPALGEVPLFEFFGTQWKPVSFHKSLFGFIPLLTGSVLITGLSTILLIPFGIGGSVYLSEFTKPMEREILKPVLEVLAGIPSVVLGFFGLVVIGPLLKEIFGLSSGLTALTGSLLLALMAIPTVITISEDALHSVPDSYKDASLALGANHWETTWKVVVPAASSGIIAAVLLGIGRVIGETMAVLMVTGNAAVITFSPFESVRTLTATIAAEMGEVPQGGVHYHVLFLIGFVLFSMTLGVNLFARRLLKKKLRRNLV